MTVEEFNKKHKDEWEIDLKHPPCIWLSKLFPMIPNYTGQLKGGYYCPSGETVFFDPPKGHVGTKVSKQVKEDFKLVCEQLMKERL